MHIQAGQCGNQIGAKVSEVTASVRVPFVRLKCSSVSVVLREVLVVGEEGKLCRVV